MLMMKIQKRRYTSIFTQHRANFNLQIKLINQNLKRNSYKRSINPTNKTYHKCPTLNKTLWTFGLWSWKSFQTTIPEKEENIRRLWLETSTGSSGSRRVPSSPAQPLNTCSHLKSLFSFDCRLPWITTSRKPGNLIWHPPKKFLPNYYWITITNTTIGLKRFKWDFTTSQSKF